MKKDKTNLKMIVTIIVSVIISSSITAFAAIKINATEIGYNNTTVADQLDSLYQTMFSNNYSTEEKQVGKWIDGKPLYQKTFSTILQSSDDNIWKTIGTIGDINIVGIQPFALTNGGVFFMKDDGYASSNSSSQYMYHSIIHEIENNNIKIYSKFINLADYPTNYYLTIQYTKKTDQPQTN